MGPKYATYSNHFLSYSYLYDLKTYKQVLKLPCEYAIFNIHLYLKLCWFCVCIKLGIMHNALYRNTAMK